MGQQFRTKGVADRSKKYDYKKCGYKHKARVSSLQQALYEMWDDRTFQNWL